MKDVDDLDRVRDMLVGEVPDPCSAVPEDDPAPGAEEPAPLHPTRDPSGEGSRFPVRIAGRDRFDGGVVADGPGVADRPALAERRRSEL